jgi:hypothetical protein
MGQTEGQRDAAAVQQAAAQHQMDLFNIGAPGVRLALGDFLSGLGTAGQTPQAIDELYSGLQATNTAEFNAAEDSATSTVNQMAKQSGYRGAKGAVGDVASQTLLSLESARRTNERALTEQKTDAAISQRDFNLSQILGIGTGAGGQSMQSYQNALGVANTFDNRNPWGSAAAGAASGAAAGSVVPGWGTVIGGILGGVSGYFG